MSTAEELLDPSSLQTVLAMLAAIESVDELALLEQLTTPQKHQVWAATPPALRERLKSIRATGTPPPTVPSPKANAIPAPSPLLEDPDQEVELDGDLDQDPEIALGVELDGAIDRFVSVPVTQPQVGDWVVLHAHPKLTTAELKAIWKVVVVQATYAEIAAPAIGTRHYPIDWMVRYPRPDVEEESV